MFRNGFSRKLAGVMLSLPPAGVELPSPELDDEPTSSARNSTSTVWIVRSEGRLSGFQCRFLSGRWDRTAVRMLAQSGAVRNAGGAEYVEITRWEDAGRSIAAGEGYTVVL